MSSPTVRRMCPCPCLLRTSRPILNVWSLKGGYLCLDELGMHKLKGDSTRGGLPKGGHESHLISTTYICGVSAGGRWGRCTGGGQRRCSRGCGLRCVPTRKCIGWTCIIVCHGAYVITSVQTHLIYYLTCLLHGVVMHRCVMPTRYVTPTRCVTLTRLIASMPLTSTYLPTTPYSQFTCVAHNACIIQGQLTVIFNSFQGINTVGVDLGPWFALRHYLQLWFNLSQVYKSSVSRLN